MHVTEYHVRLAAYAVITQTDRILLSWWNGEGRHEPAWTLPGGGVEFDESVTDALVREVFEETGHHVAVGALLGESHIVRPAQADAPPIRSQRLYYAATITGGELGTTEVDGTTDFAAWLPIAGLAGQPVVDGVFRGLALLDAQRS